MKPSEIVELLNSPPWIATLIKYLLSGSQQIRPNGLNFELIFICIPFLMNEKIVNELSHGNKRSNLGKIFSNKKLQGQFHQAKNSIDYYRPFIQQAMILLSATEKLTISSNVFLSQPEKDLKKINDSFKVTYCKAAFNFGAILSKEEPVEIIIRFGV